MIQITEKHDKFDKIMGDSGYQMVLCANSPLYINGMVQAVRDDTPPIQWNVVAAPFTAAQTGCANDIFRWADSL